MFVSYFGINWFYAYVLSMIYFLDKFWIFEWFFSTEGVRIALSKFTFSEFWRFDRTARSESLAALPRTVPPASARLIPAHWVWVWVWFWFG